MRTALAACAVVLTALTARPARADPQWNVSAITGVCGSGTRDSFWQDTCWWNGLRGDVILGRAREKDVGIGPHLSLETAGFDDLRLGAGATTVLPLIGSVPFALSAGGYARSSSAGWEPGVAGSLFFGSRSYNFHGSYAIAAGLLVGLNVGLGDSRETAIVVAGQVDMLFLLMPFIAAYGWVHGPPDDHE